MKLYLLLVGMLILNMAFVAVNVYLGLTVGTAFNWAAAVFGALVSLFLMLLVITTTKLIR